MSSSGTVAKVATAPPPEEPSAPPASTPRIVTRPRTGQWTTTASVLRGLGLTLWLQDLLHSVQLVHHRTCQVIPLLMVATIWHVVVTSVLGVGQCYVERHYARGSERAR